MSLDQNVTLVWNGIAHYHINYEGVRVVIDPVYTRPPGDRPHLTATKQELDRLDYLLLTHGHMDHSWDFPYLVSRHMPQAYAPEAYLDFIQGRQSESGFDLDGTRCHALEKAKGSAFPISDIEVTPYQIGTEEIDSWFFRTMLQRPLRHLAFRAMPQAVAFLRYHLRENCFAYHFRFPSGDKTMLYFGNLTDQVDELREIERVSVLAIPFCPANRKWLSHTVYLVGRFNPDVTLVHHFDDFWHPFTDARYRDLNSYRKSIREIHPGAKLFFSKFQKEVELAEIV